MPWAVGDGRSARRPFPIALKTMLLVALLTLPLAAAALSYLLWRVERLAILLGVLFSGAQFVLALFLVFECLAKSAVSMGSGDFLRADALTAVLILVVTGVSWISIWFGVDYMNEVRRAGHVDNTLLRRYYVLTHLFEFTMLLAVTANNVGVMWVAVEATTITTAFLIGLQQSKASLEASWKYILIGSVGIALAFVGTVLGYFSFVQRVGATEYALNWTVLLQVADKLNGDVMRIAFVFLLVGYGTKAGLAPMYTWLPDAHSEAPAPISSMMSGSLLVVALYAILRWKVVVDTCIGPDFSNRMLLLMGILSLGLAALMLIRQTSYKRMLAYSSVEHMGLICLGLGLGPLGILAALLHMLSHAAGKSLLFLLSGRILEFYQSPRIASVRGLLRAMPWVGGLMLLGSLALLGLPPFGLFVSEVMLFQAGFYSGHVWITAAALLCVVVIFVFFLGYVNRLLYGKPPESLGGRIAGTQGLWPLSVNVGVLLLLGLAIPGPLLRLLTQAVEIVQR